jgi:carboxylesterase type B
MPFPDDWEHSQDDEKLGQEIRADWTQFVNTGDPNGGVLPHWPAYDEHSNEYFELGRSLGIRPVSPRLDVIGKIMEQLRSVLALLRQTGKER